MFILYILLKIYPVVLGIEVFIYCNSLASGVKRILSGRATTKTSPSRGQNPPDRIVVTFTDVFDPVSIDRIHHTADCKWCRRLWSTIQFRHPYADGQVWAGMISEFLKLLGTTGVQSKFSI